MINIENINHNESGTEFYKKGEVIIRDNDFECSKMYIIIEGSAKVYKNYGEMGEVSVARLSMGDFFGEMSLFLGRGRTATVVADEDITLIALDKDNALDFFREQPEATYSLISTLCSRLVNTNVNMADNSVRFEKIVIGLNDEKEKFKSAANTDALTGVFNRRCFMDTAAKMLKDSFENGNRAFVTMIDIDFFKKVNDTYGHQAGDETLKRMAAVVANTLRERDLFARYGGEEFIMLFTGLTSDAAQKMVERVRENIKAMEIIFEDLRIRVTASFGIAEVVAAEGIESAIAKADEALYEAKQGGRDRSVFYN
ncbi:MAG: GGDEF domain-containing protein [Oscillospiraceae bacterium]|nr:GGDEF domain-containing protein [Oscillospiraceae bacterium]